MAWGLYPSMGLCEQIAAHAEQLYDFGVCEPDSQYEHIFQIQNVLKHDIQVTACRESCGCVLVSEYPRTIKSGSVAEVGIKLSTGRSRGKIAATVMLSTNEQVLPQIALTVKATVISAWARPGDLDFGRVSQGAILRKTVSIRGAGLSPVPRWKVSPSDNRLTVKTSAPRDSENSVLTIPQQLCLATIAFDSTDLVGGELWQGYVIFTDEAQRVESIRIPITCRIEDKVSVEPRQIFFSYANAKASKTRTCTLPNLGKVMDKPSIDRLRFIADHSYVTAKMLDPIGGAYQVTVIGRRPVDKSSPVQKGSISAMLGDDVIFTIPYTVFVGSQLEQ